MDNWTPDRPSRGFGDTIAKMTHAMHIQQCDGCTRRQSKMNAWRINWLLYAEYDPEQAELELAQLEQLAQLERMEKMSL